MCGTNPKSGRGEAGDSSKYLGSNLSFTYYPSPYTGSPTCHTYSAAQRKGVYGGGGGGGGGSKSN